MWRCNASIAEREQFRSLSAAKVQKIFQKTAFGEGINTIPTLKCAFCQEKRYIEDGEAPILYDTYQVPVIHGFLN